MIPSPTCRLSPPNSVCFSLHTSLDAIPHLRFFLSRVSGAVVSANMSYQAPPAVYPPPPSNAYPPPGQAYPPQPVEGYAAPAYVAPPPAGYPSKDGAQYPQQGPAETKDRGDGFWKGCCAALCCCCVLDMCF